MDNDRFQKLIRAINHLSQDQLVCLMQALSTYEEVSSKALLTEEELSMLNDIFIDEQE
ncbi:MULTISPECIES: hypothetical protein [unclassified Vibrio]|uniref:hypothetical protein n=1 Tax=unclassified Vibrio TaxID=2614977 RepID=UPI001361B273|nr:MULTISPECIES: hypothetical protein [unclassified Vibrio]NAW60073.1 hypothetical protein [Vibrio sp. V36_P2S2PM302]NAX25970.1 hypothetical protein [Vibrio sp. V38_P2S17PM301]NAX30648.1 hypothetical protein [Vibrio sp. V37_P2S8PM304]